MSVCRTSVCLVVGSALLFAQHSAVASNVNCCQYNHNCFDDGRYPDVNKEDCEAGSEPDRGIWKPNHYCDAAGEYCIGKSVQTVPTVSQWGVVLIAVLLLTGITLKFAQRVRRSKAA